MRPYDLHFFPHPPLYLLLFFLILGLAFVLLRYVLIGYVYERLGLSRRAAFTILFAALLGSWINIPLVQLPAQRVIQPRIVDFFGMQYVIPHVVERGSTVIAINVGGGLIPVLLVVYLVANYGISRRGLLALGIVTLVTYLVAQPVAGVGIALPPLVPSLVTAVAAILLDPWAAPRTAFIAGSLGTLIGADLLNLGNLQVLGAPVASIGGAGTFDGIFMTGVIAVLLSGAPALGPKTRRPSDNKASGHPDSRVCGDRRTG
ncbi:MAG TPA: DUF1614 domain-containing protein [Candidatus Methylomirabilis sp.]|nr:DUF1614 domain-containing protein [Candidatus Methylomirabilis sp.]